MKSLLNQPMVLREIIMDHYAYPRNHQLSDAEGYVSKHMASASCIDDIQVHAKVKDDVIEDIRFDGVACTIATASTSIMSELLMGKKVAEAREIIANYYAMIDEKPYDEELLQEAIAFHNVGKQANRIKCATIGWRGLEAILDGSEGDENG